MRHTEFWARLEHTLGEAYAHHWADQFVIADLDSRTAGQALREGVPPKRVWASVWRALELPASER